MSQRCVEQVIGRLVTDEAFRKRFAADPDKAVHEVMRCGWELTSLERQALGTIDLDKAARFADAIDPRIQKAEINGGRS